MIIRFITIFIALAIPLFASDPINAARLIYGGSWNGKVGVEGGIPTSYAQSGSTINAYTGTATQINDALANAANNTFVLLGPGTFTLSSAIAWTDDKVILRGAVDSNGAPATTLIINGAPKITIGQSVRFDLTGTFTNINVSTSASTVRGLTTVALASTPTGMVTNQVIFFTATGQGGDDFYGFGSSGTGRTWTHWARVTGVSGNNVSFTPAISADYLTAGLQCSYQAGLWMTQLSGLENVIVTGSPTNDVFVRMQGADSCWIKNCKIGPTSGTSQVMHIYMYATFRNEVRHCELWGQNTYGSSSYIFNAFAIGAFMAIDNYIHDVANVMPMFNVHGSAFVYNYINALSYDSPTGWLSQIVYDHGAQNDYNLIEGNWLAASWNDDAAASQNVTMLRNRMRGYDAAGATGPTTQDTIAITLADGHFNRVVAGNVLGEASYTNDYENIFTGADDFPTRTVFNLRNTVTATLIRKANYNVVDAGIPASEALTGGEVLVDSYLFSSKPSNFGICPWPWVVPTNFSQSNTFTNFPAGYRAQNGVDPPAAATGGTTLTGTVTITGAVTIQ